MGFRIQGDLCEIFYKTLRCNNEQYHQKLKHRCSFEKKQRVETNFSCSKTIHSAYTCKKQWKCQIYSFIDKNICFLFDLCLSFWWHFSRTICPKLYLQCKINEAQANQLTLILKPFANQFQKFRTIVIILIEIERTGH